MPGRRSTCVLAPPRAIPLSLSHPPSRSPAHSPSRTLRPTESGIDFILVCQLVSPSRWHRRRPESTEPESASSSSESSSSSSVRTCHRTPIHLPGSCLRHRRRFCRCRCTEADMYKRGENMYTFTSVCGRRPRIVGVIQSIPAHTSSQKK